MQATDIMTLGLNLTLSWKIVASEPPPESHFSELRLGGRLSAEGRNTLGRFVARSAHTKREQGDARVAPLTPPLVPFMRVCACGFSGNQC